MSERLENWARRLDVIVEVSGRIAAWTGLALVLVMAGNVIARYFLHIGSVATQELEWHLMAPLTLLCIAYTIKHDGHVRVDIFYSSLPEIARRAIDLFSALCALALAVLIVKISMPYVLQSYRIGEGSPDPGGLPYRWIIKAMIPAGFALFGVQSLASVLRALKPFFGGSDGLKTASINAV
ncbi:TRAP transporter small permease subunit [Hansschlegelia beijingensis]|uniref:TRAP transporter small permease subunit n=1 Tax=Hansschlegelia beijingensis TaxID=1133344 RepID=UPI00387F09CD